MVTHPFSSVPAEGELDREELVEVVQEAWVARASPRWAAAWLRSAGLNQ